MARPTRNSTPATDTPAATDSNEESTMTTTDTLEAPAATDTPTEAPAEVTEAPATEAPTTPAKTGPTAEEKLAAFTTALDAVTGDDAPDAPLTDEQTAPVVAAFRALRGGSVKQASAVFADRTKACMKARKIDLAEALVDLQEVCLAPAPKSESTPKAPADPREAFLARYVPLAIATASLLAEAPEGTDIPDAATFLEALGAYKAWVATPDTEEAPRGEAPEVSPHVVAAHRVLSGKGAGAKKSGTPRAPRADGEARKNVASVILAAFEGTPEGTVLTPTEISNKGGGDYAPGECSTGAISNRIKAGTVEGIVATEKDGSLAAKRG